MVVNTKNSAKERAFKRAQSHSKRVRKVRRVLPAMAFAVIGIFGLAIFALRPATNLALDLPSTTLSDGKLVMANPNLDGFTNDQRPFRVTALRAIQDLAAQDALELDQLAADVELEGGQLARLTSSSGIFNSNSNMLVLPNESQITTSDGLQATIGKADINIQTGSVLATKSVKIVNTESVITADAMQIEDGGKRIVFEDNVRFVLQPKPENSMSQKVRSSQTASSASDKGIN